ncbi:MAG: energy coupling factor transporter S component ThiW [Bacillota bacterium]
MNAVKKLAFASVLVALAVICSAFYIPVGVAKCFPAQHAVNVISGILLGPWYAMGIAFTTSLIRVLLGTGTLLAFPGSMIGALLCGLAYMYTKKLPLAFLGEVIGTGVFGALVAYPVATLILAKEATLFAFVIPFSISTIGGTAIAVFVIYALKKTKLLNKYGLMASG